MSLTSSANGDGDSGSSDDLRDGLGETSDEQSDDTLGEHRGGDVDGAPVHDFLPVGGVLELRGGPESEGVEHDEGGDDDVGDLPDRAGQNGRQGGDSSLCHGSATLHHL
jgi:hypothetical protein